MLHDFYKYNWIEVTIILKISCGDSICYDFRKDGEAKAKISCQEKL